MGLGDRPIPTSVWQRHHQANGSAASLRESRTLQLRRPKLRLEVEQSSLDLDGNELVRGLQDQIGGAPIGRDANWHFEPNPPARVRGCPDLIRDGELPRVTQPDATAGKQANRKVMTGGGCQAMHPRQGGHRPTRLDEADQALAHSCSACHLPLGEAGNGAGRDELAGESHCYLPLARIESHARSGHRATIPTEPDRTVTAQLPPVC